MYKRNNLRALTALPPRTLQVQAVGWDKLTAKDAKQAMVCIYSMLAVKKVPGALEEAAFKKLVRRVFGF